MREQACGVADRRTRRPSSASIAANGSSYVVDRTAVVMPDGSHACSRDRAVSVGEDPETALGRTARHAVGRSARSRLLGLLVPEATRVSGAALRSETVGRLRSRSTRLSASSSTEPASYHAVQAYGVTDHPRPWAYGFRTSLTNRPLDEEPTKRSYIAPEHG